MLLLGSFVGWWTLVELPRARAEEARHQREACRKNLEQIVVACRLFREMDGQGQRYPFDWTEAMRSGEIQPETLRCPLDTSKGQSSYSYLGDSPMVVAAERYVLAYETFHNHKDGGPPGHLVAFADLKVRWIPTQELQAILRRQKQGLDR